MKDEANLSCSVAFPSSHRRGRAFALPVYQVTHVVFKVRRSSRVVRSSGFSPALSVLGNVASVFLAEVSRKMAYRRWVAEKSSVNWQLLKLGSPSLSAVIYIHSREMDWPCSAIEVMRMEPYLLMICALGKCFT